jgi:hypothetical protein
MRSLVAASLLVGILFGGCGSVALQPSGTAGGDGAAGAAAAGATGTAGSGTAGSGAAGSAGAGPAGHGGGGAGGSDAGHSPGTVTLRLNLPPTTSFCDMSCSPAAQRHITIFGVDKKPVPIDPPSCLVMCSETCQPFACPAGGACALTGVAVTGAELKWDGAEYPQSTCGAGYACYKPAYVPAGTYIAHMCATPGSLTSPLNGQPICTTNGQEACTDVTFTLPGKSVVEGTLAGVVPGCGAIRASDYSQSCVENIDCAVVWQGDTCQSPQCMCPNVAISGKDEMRYLADLDRKLLPPPSICNCPAIRAPSCIQGKCAL